MNEDKLNLSKFVMSFFQWLPWIKTLRHLIGIILIVLLIGCVYVKFFKKDTQEAHFSGDVETVNIIQKSKRFFIPFVEGFAGVATGDDDMNAGIRTGVRVEF